MQAEYLARIVLEVKRRPEYVVREVVGAIPPSRTGRKEAPENPIGQTEQEPGEATT